MKKKSDKRKFFRDFVGGFALLVSGEKQKKFAVRPAKNTVARSKRWDSK